VSLLRVNPLFEEVARREGFYSEDLMRTISEEGSLRHVEGVPEWARRLFTTAHEVSPQWHVRMQAAFQRHTDNAVSKTINFPHDATREDVADAYMLAYREGCKGITIYRDRSREEQVLVTEKARKPSETRITPRRRPVATTGRTEKVSTGCGNLYVTVNSDEQGICEVFSHLGKAGGCASAQSEACSRLISLALRSGVDADAIVEQLRGIRCPSISWDRGQSILSCPDAIGGVLERYSRALEGREEEPSPKREHRPEPVEGLDEGLNDNPKKNPSAWHGNVVGQCPDCSSLLVFQEGCYICHFCGYTKC
jgi:ribonucleoside-diphosphate reductase alpha chain